MWFKQVQIFQLTSPIKYTAMGLHERLLPFAYTPCSPSMAQTSGWVSPVDEPDAPLSRGLNGCFLIQLQIEEKILPASVVNHALKEKVKQIAASEGRKPGKSEKARLKDETTHTLLLRAFSKFTQIAAYIDTRHQWLVVNCASASRTETFLTMFKKAFGDGIASPEFIKPSSLTTQWLKDEKYPQTLSIEKACVLQDPNIQHRVIRCQEQNLFSPSIQGLVKEGCQAIQIQLCWQDRLRFTIADDFVLRGLRIAEEDTIELNDQLETKQEKFDADLLIMSELHAGLFKDLLEIFDKNQAIPREENAANAA